MPNVRRGVLTAKVEEQVKPGTEVITDSLKSYFGLQGDYVHNVIDHSEKYVDGKIHTNGLENFWSLLKRGVMGTFHKVSKKYLPLYVVEFQFRYNDRGNADIFGAAIRAC